MNPDLHAMMLTLLRACLKIKRVAWGGASVCCHTRTVTGCSRRERSYSNPTREAR